jgi:3',5'-cyclic-AMP phosphodiesterase
MRLSWLTDIHLNFLKLRGRRRFYRTVLEGEPDVLLVGGDMAEGTRLLPILSEMEEALAVPIYFVLGNHDFYGGSIAKVRAGVARACETSPLLHWLPKAGLVQLGPSTGLLGHDSWADGRFGDYQGSNMILNDYFLIHDFSLQDKQARLKRMRGLARMAANFFARHLPMALRDFDRIIVLTHAPPFREASWYQGRISNDSALPHFACKVVGEVLAGAMRAHPHKRMTVLCGHTHGRGRAEILPNLTVYTGGATYGEPEVQRVFEIPD